MKITLTEEQVTKLTEATDALKKAMGPNADMWNIGEKSRVSGAHMNKKQS
jgi:hypothetical protein